MIGLVTFICAFGGALVGLLLRNYLPDHHFSEDSKDTVKMGAGLVATLSALVLGLLISSAKTSYDTMNTALTQSGAKIILLDRALARYGPETKEIREVLRRSVASRMKMVWPESPAGTAKPKTYENSPVFMEALQDKLRALSPQNNIQRSRQEQALRLSDELLQTRWLMIEQTQVSLPNMFFVILLFWLTILFATIGLFAPCNTTVIVVLLVCTLSVSGAIFLIQEMSRPFEGIMKTSSAPLVKALEHLGK
jgi:hypothetical protein